MNTDYDLGVDWQLLRNPLLVLLLIVAVGGVAAFALQTQVVEFQLRENQVKFKVEQARQRLAAARENYKYVKQYYDRYRELVGAGVIAAEDRLQWIDAARAAADAIKIPFMDYQLNPLRRVLPEAGGTPSEVAVNYSPMFLKLNLLHEGDFIAFINRLETQARGLFDIDYCKLERRTEKLVYQAEATNVSVTCDLRWYTIGAVL